MITFIVGFFAGTLATLGGMWLGCHLRDRAETEAEAQAERRAEYVIEVDERGFMVAK